MSDVSRRKLMKAVGAAGVGASLGVGSVQSAALPFCDGCPPGTNLLAKFGDWDEDEGEWMEAEGACSDAVTFTEVETNEDGEPVAVWFSSEQFFQEVQVKTGNAKGDACDTLTREEVREDSNEKDGEYRGRLSIDDIGEEDAISYIAFCSAVCFQVDFVFGDPIPDFGEDDDGFYGKRKIVHLFGNTYSRATSGTQGLTETWDGCTVTTDPITADFDAGTASVTFDVDGSLEDCDLWLVSYVAPCPMGFTPETADFQHLYAKDDGILMGDDGYVLEVALPTASDLQAVCTEGADSGGFVR